MPATALLEAMNTMAVHGMGDGLEAKEVRLEGRRIDNIDVEPRASI
jgi:hypothetical protein